MFSIKTCSEIVFIIENWDAAIVDRCMISLEIESPKSIKGSYISKAKKANAILDAIKKDFVRQKEVLKYIIDKVNREESANSTGDPFTFEEPKDADTIFAEKYPELVNSLKRDGFRILNSEIVSLLPEALEHAKVESELILLLEKHNLTVSKGHLEQAIKNHAEGNWAAANAQFRSFFESLLVGIADILDSSKKHSGYADAYTCLSSTSLNPEFFSSDLNEIAKTGAKNDKTYVVGLWNRLHPEGSHPGLSDEEDCTFRYHTVLIFARYVLNRLDDRIG